MTDNNFSFTHLHVHTGYSLLDGLAKIDEIIKKVKELNMHSIAITDHGVMYGIIDFYKCAKNNGIKPILGCEVYVSATSRFDKSQSPENIYYHLILLAENNEGYQNLIKLSSLGFTEGFYYKPRVDIELLRKYSKGLIALSACLAGPVAKNVLRTSYDKAKEIALLYNDIFGNGNFFLELQDHGIDEQKTVNQAILRIHNETGIPIVCTNDSHYINKEDSVAHDILLCVQTGKTVDEEKRIRYYGDNFYIKSTQEMINLFPYAKDGIENTNKIANRCNVDIEFNNYKLPIFDVPKDENTFDYLQKLCYIGLKNRYKNITSELEERLSYELKTINEMGFIDYFLIVYDFIKYAKDNDIMVGPGRGSAAGSLVAYCLQITDIDPIEYSLIFERFLNPERISMPDIDIDFCYERRQEVINYVIDKYGAEKVAQIITFGTMAARNAIRDVGRALNMPYADVDKIAKMIPIELKITIDKALKLNKELKSEYEDNEAIRYLIDMSKKLEGLPRHSSIHAAGIVICDKCVDEYVPITYNEGTTTQFTMNTIEELGLLKMDFLGLRTLTVIKNAFSEINRIHNIEINPNKLDFNDTKVFHNISLGKTEGVFQLESSGMKQFMKDLKPNSIDDIIAGISLYRPGPMDFIPKYIDGKNNGKYTRYTHPKLEPILKSTYGCIVYQEQVMEIVRELAGYSLGRSDLVRRAMSKKKEDVMAQERKNFIYGIDGEIDGCLKNGIDEISANKIFDEMTDFAKYAFNKSHAAAYAVISYQTAWLKTHYPIEFMSALLTSVIDNSSKISEYIAASKRMEIKILPPDINESLSKFSVYNNKIRFALTAIKNVGKNNINSIIKNREKNGEFKSLTDFINRLSSDINIRAIESLIKAGAFDSLGGYRSQYLEVCKNIYNGVSQNKKKNIEGQLDLFSININNDESNTIISSKDELPKIEEFEKSKLLKIEKDILGLYISGHPLDQYLYIIKRTTSHSSTDFILNNDLEENIELNDKNDSITDGQRVIIGGIITDISNIFTKNGKQMSFITLEDLFGTIEIILFPEVHNKFSKFILEEKFIICHGKTTISADQSAKVICDKIVPYEFLTENLETLWLKIDLSSNLKVEDIIPTLSQNFGNTKVIIYDEKTKNKFNVNRQNWVNISENLTNELKQILGENNVIIK